MLYQTSEGSYGFRFQDNSQANVASIYIIGHENRTLLDYHWDGMTRDDGPSYIFQYTLSGKGIIEVGEERYTLSTGHVFIVKVPSEHRYYLPKGSPHWEFIYITLKGKEAITCWEYIQHNFGTVMTIPREAPVIQLLFTLYCETKNGEISDSFIASLKAYEFIIACYRYFKNITKLNEEIPDYIKKAVLYMKTHYNQPRISLDEIAEQANLSKFYFIKKFNEYMNTSPIEYLTKLRIERAFILLRDTDITVKEIACQVGYSDPNYFNKVFRKIVGTSPGRFRQSNYNAPFGHLIID